MKKNVTEKESHFVIVFRKHSRIKSRQWFISNLSEIRKELLKKLPSKKKKLLVKLCKLAVLITNNSEIKKLNTTYRKVNKPTDVLSFHLKPQFQAKYNYLGDIIISLAYARNNAKEKKISLEQEILLLLIHSYLHLLGYDHLTLKEEKKMFKLQNDILLSLE